jgi:hypothetical protein
VQINPLRYNSFNRANISNTNWAHNPAHRGAVPYRDRAVAQQFGSQRASAAREAFRGKADAGRQQLSKGKDGAAARSNLKNAANTKAGSKQAGAKQASKQTRSNQAARSKQAGSKQGARPKQTAGNRQRAASRQAARPASRAQRPYAGGRGQRSFASARGGFSRGGGARAGGGRGGGGRGGGRRSDIELKHDIVLLGHLANGLGFYRFAYNGSNTAYVGVMAQEVQTVTPAAVTRGRDGYLRVFYEQLGLTLQTYQEWLAAGARMPRVIQK